MCFSVTKIRTSGIRTSGDRTSGGPPILDVAKMCLWLQKGIYH